MFGVTLPQSAGCGHSKITKILFEKKIVHYSYMYKQYKKALKPIKLRIHHYSYLCHHNTMTLNHNQYSCDNTIKTIASKYSHIKCSCKKIELLQQKLQETQYILG